MSAPLDLHRIRAHRVDGAVSLVAIGCVLAWSACVPVGAGPDAGVVGVVDGGAHDAGEVVDGGAQAGGDAGDVDGGADAGDGAHGGAPDAGDSGVDGGTSGGYGPYDIDGTDTVSTVDIDVVSDNGDHFSEHVFIPSSAGPHPVVSLSPGLQQPALAYTTFGTRLASHGIVVVAHDDPGALVNTPNVTADIVYVVNTWLPEQNTDAASPLFGALDLTHVGLAGHSRGGKASLIAAEDLPGAVVAWFGLDPIDAAALGNNTFAVTNVATVGMPIAYLGAQISSSCSPANSNSDVLFAASVAPAVQIVGIGAGHTQLEDQDQCVLCTFCTPSGTADDAVVLRYAARYLTAFFARELLGDATVGAAFDGAGIGNDVADGLVVVHEK